MKKITQYVLDNAQKQSLNIPSEKILSAKYQNGSIVVYVVADDELQTGRDYEFLLYSTDQEVIEGIQTYSFLDTIKSSDSAPAYHIFFREIGFDI